LTENTESFTFSVLERETIWKCFLFGKDSTREIRFISVLPILYSSSGYELIIFGFSEERTASPIITKAVLVTQKILTDSFY